MKPHVDSSSRFNPSHDVNNIKQDSPFDSALKPFISHYNPNECARIRRNYLTNGPYQPYNCDFFQNNFSGVMIKINTTLSDKYKSWLEYSTSKSMTFCLPCYLFRPKNLGSDGRTNFIGEGSQN
jgi:hypothetical protein